NGSGLSTWASCSPATLRITIKTSPEFADLGETPGAAGIGVPAAPPWLCRRVPGSLITGSRIRLSRGLCGMQPLALGREQLGLAGERPRELHALLTGYRPVRERDGQSAGPGIDDQNRQHFGIRGAVHVPVGAHVQPRVAE